MSGERYYQVDVQLIPDSWMDLNNRKATVYDFIETFMLFCITHPLAAIVLYLTTRSGSYIIDSYMLSFALLYITCVRCYIRRNYIFVPLLILIVGLVYILPLPLLAKIFVEAYVVISCMVSCSIRLRQAAEYKGINFYIFGGCAFALEYIILLSNGYTGIAAFTVADCIAYSFLCMIYIHISRTRKLMEWEKQTSVESIKRINSASLKFIILLVVVFLSGIIILWRSGYLKFDHKLLMAIIEHIKKFFSRSETKPQKTPDKPAENDIDMDKISEGLNKNSRSGNPLIGRIIQILFTAITIPAVVYFAIVLLRMLYHDIFYYLSRVKPNNGEEKESMLRMDDIVENVKVKLNIFKGAIASPFDVSNSRKIRRIYYRLVNESKKRNTVIEESDTPHAIEDIVKRDSKRNIGSATGIYEKARYGVGEPSREDVERINNLRKNNKLKI